MAKDIKELAKEWLELDEDKTTTDEIYKLLVNDDNDELERRLRHRIAFGTAGLRGPMQGGFACMNSLTVIQASQGLAAYLLKTEKNVKRRESSSVGMRDTIQRSLPCLLQPHS
ncbi:hypothetical protein P3342_000524 [Pyrenophora teres f. teres]|nr:hypothetical protein P3342_000524 [Pyrenophora teres f. teres]